MVITPASFKRFCRARDLLGEEREPPLSIAEVARTVGISRFHFTRGFQAMFGMTPHQFRARARLDRAKELLARGRHSVTAVCMEVGFSSVGTFSALFARRVGATPSSYQRDVRLPDAAPGCLTLMGMLPEAPHRKFEEARAARRSKIPPCASS